MTAKKTIGKRVSLPVEDVPVARLKPAPWNPRRISDHDFENLQRLIREFGLLQPIVANRDGTVIGGHQRLKAAIAIGMKTVPVVYVDFSDERAKALNIGFNRTSGDWDEDLLERLVLELAEFDDPELLKLTGLTKAEVDYIEAQAAAAASEAEGRAAGAGSLVERFVVPPFSVLDAKQGYWRERKAEWLALGIRSEEGRDWNLHKLSTAMEIDLTNRNAKIGLKQTAFKLGGLDWHPMPAYGGTSIFDPVLCEILYRWFAPRGGRVLDPFAGGSVRGVVAAALGLRYVGIDLSSKQITANVEQWKAIRSIVQKSRFANGHPPPTPSWVVGNALDVAKKTTGDFDFVLTCPPYYNLERYSEDPRDLSNYKTYDDFLRDFAAIVKAAVHRLKKNRFAAMVVGDLRDERGLFRRFPASVVDAFEAAGAHLFNDAILVTPFTTLPIRTSSHFHRGRKLGKTHQNVLVFWKGDPRAVPPLPKSFSDEDLKDFLDFEGVDADA